MTDAPKTKKKAQEKHKNKRALLNRANSLLLIAATLGGALALNALASHYFWRVDLTKNGIYTLSKASKDAVANLEDDIYIRAFISPDLPPPMHTLAQNTADALEEYAAASGGKLTYEIISPREDADVEEDAQSLGCEKVAIGQQSEDEVSLRAVYKCVAFSMGDNLEVVEDLRDAPGAGIASFEYDFTKALLNLQKTEPRNIGFATGFGGPASNPQFIASLKPAFKQLYGELIAIREVELSEELEQIPEDIHTLIILNAEEPFSDEARFAIDQFLQRGGSVGWFQSSTAPDWGLAQQMMEQYPGQEIPPLRRPLDPGLSDLFAAYGLELRHDLVLDPKHGVTALAMTPQGLAQITQPATFLMEDFDQELPFMRDLGVLALPAPSTIIVNGNAAMNDEITVHRLIQTSESALRRPKPPELFNFDSLAQADPAEESGKWTVAAAIQGQIPSFYEDNPPPESRKDTPLNTDKNNARLLIIGSGDFFQPVPEVGYEQELAGLGGQLLIGSMEWLVQDTALSEIRSKAMPRLLGEVPRQTQRSIQFLNIAVVPALFGLLGLIMMRRRRRRREQLMKRYSAPHIDSD